MSLKRKSCARCLRPNITCICHLISAVDTDIEVLILQHPLEVTETKGTARLLHLCLPNSELLIGEVFDTDILASAKQSFLLYPITAPTVRPRVTPSVDVSASGSRQPRLSHSLRQQLPPLLRQLLCATPRRHWRLAASDDAQIAAVVNDLAGEIASDQPT